MVGSASEKESAAQIFDVAIVAPLEEKKTVPPVTVPPEIPVKAPRKMPKEEDELPPETMFGGGTDVESGSAESGKGGSTEETFLSDRKEEPSEEAEGLSTKKPGTFLFDNEIIKKYAQKDASEGKDVTFDVSEFHHRGYMRMLKDKIERIWRYPREAAILGISGDLYIRFSIKRDGSVGTIELVRTSGYRSLDEAAMKAIEDGEPFWPLPPDWESDDLTITGHFIYIIGRSYIM
jgi:protein TonB